MEPVAAFDPNDARAVLYALMDRVTRALAELAGEGFRCLRAVPRIDGTLYLDLETPGGPLRADWIGPASASGVLCLAGGEVEDDVVRLRVQEAIVAVLTEPGSLADCAWLWYAPASRETFRFGLEGIRELLAGRLVGGQSRWFGYRFEELGQDRPGVLRLRFRGASDVVGFEMRAAVPPIDKQGLVASNRVAAVHLIEDSRDPAQRALLVHQVERFLGFVLERATPRGLSLDVVSYGQALGHSDGAPVSTSRWGNPRQWFQFFSDFEIERAGLCGCRFIDPISWITHGEMECRWVEPELVTRRMDYVNVPWEQDPPGGGGGTSVFSTLEEEDVVMGGAHKLQAALDKATSDPGARFVCMNNTCLPKIIGDDVSSAIRRHSRTVGIPVLSMNTDLDSPDTSFHDLVRQAREQAVGDGEPRNGQGLNLIGYPPNRGRRELLAGLDAVGVRVNTCLLPDIGIDLLRQYMRGAGGVVYPHRSWVQIAEKILAEDQLGVPWRMLPAPYGLRRTESWFAVVAADCGRTRFWKSWRDQKMDELRPAWDRLIERARQHTLAFVVDEGDLDRLIDPQRLYGFELLPLIEEMGFAISVLVRTDEPAAPAGMSRLSAALEHPERLVVQGFSTPARLADLLAAGDFKAVYSEVFYDTRISRAGKAQFNLSMIEMGWEGALRSLERLVGLCEWTFYRTYARYMIGS